MDADKPRIVSVRGHLDDEVRAEILSFWEARRALPSQEAQRRLPEVACIVRLDGAIAGVSSAHPADVELIGSRRFWIYRNLLDHDVADQGPELIRATFNGLAAEFTGRRGEPLGLCLLIADTNERRRRPEAEWSDPRMLYAGYLADGRQVRIAYFDKDADISREDTYA